MRVAILISGRGSNMAALIAATRDPDFPAEIVKWCPTVRTRLACCWPETRAFVQPPLIIVRSLATERRTKRHRAALRQSGNRARLPAPATCGC